MKIIIKFLNSQSTLLNIIKLLIFLYLFMFSIQLMGSSLKMMGEGIAATLIQSTNNPLVGIFIGILSTSIIQSSSSTISIVVGLVGGGVLTVANAIPIVMGANIGTSVTNILVSLTQIKRNIEFQRSFSAAIVHDFFNVLSVLILFPLQYFTNFLGKLATFLGNEFQHIGGLNLLNPVKQIIQPLVNILISLIGNYPWIMLILSLLTLLISITKIVSTLKALIIKKSDTWFSRYLFKTPIRAFFVGLLLTSLVQSSSVVTSLIIPMAGVGLLTTVQIYPYLIGTNLGTTVTAILAALITNNVSGIIVAFSHVLFNIFGIIIWWPLKIVPLFLSNRFARICTRNKTLPILYILLFFFFIPIIVIYLLI